MPRRFEKRLTQRIEALVVSVVLVVLAIAYASRASRTNDSASTDTAGAGRQPLETRNMRPTRRLACANCHSPHRPLAADPDADRKTIDDA